MVTALLNVPDGKIRHVFSFLYEYSYFLLGEL